MTALPDPRGGEASPYDVVPYPGHPFAQTHPDRLAALGTLFRIGPPPVDGCRVLELGCGDGGNLVPMAMALPGARFLGIDASERAIARGRALVAALGLTNARLEVAAIEELELAADRFDYAIAHGVYSWVGEPVRDRLLELCRSVLSERGIAYVSYNALSGARLSGALRDMLMFHTAGLDDPVDRIEQARALLRLLVGSWSDEHEFGAIMRRQGERLLERSDETLFHDELAAINHPVYFHEFVAHAARHGLQYLAEADFFEMQTGVVPEALSDELLRVEDPILREQYLDFVKGRTFRQTLLCRAELALDRSPQPLVVETLAVSSPAQPTGDPDGEGRVTFEGPTGSTLKTDHPLVAKGLERIARSWPGAVWVRELIPQQASEDDRAAICGALLRCYAGNLVQLHAKPPAVSTSVGDRPEASPLARHQARSGEMVTNLRHASVRLEDDLGRRLVVLLDGTRDRAELLRELRAFLLETGRQEPHDLESGLERSLQGLAGLALLRAVPPQQGPAVTPTEC
ncbi:MAG TPA: class I SAM-dependent methyltransferase [Thermoleophilaceae bacterium]|nr:class I SAM-dependent methyltransferase [Thermoleophilaceae bacterium]